MTLPATDEVIVNWRRSAILVIVTVGLVSAFNHYTLPAQVWFVVLLCLAALLYPLRWTLVLMRASALHEAGRFRDALACLDRMASLERPGGPVQFPFDSVRSGALRGLGRGDEAVEILRPYRAALQVPFEDATVLNWIVEHLISAGQYQAALEAAARAGADEPPRALDPNWAVLQINLAEADYNLGKWTEALARLARLDDPADLLGLSRTALHLQRAWVLAHLGRGDEAVQEASLAQRDELPRLYRAEYHFTRAAAFLARGDLERAQTESDLASSGALRLSSARNALFFRARLALRQRRFEEAERLCREAAGHRCLAQGGDGLLLWGDVLDRLGRAGEAREAWKLAIERDPESESAHLAAQRRSVPKVE